MTTTTALTTLTAMVAANGGGDKTAFDAKAELGVDFSCFATIVTADTSNNDNCPGGSLPTNNRFISTHFGPCLDNIILPGKDGLEETDDDITIDRGGMGGTRNKQTGEVVNVQLFFTDLNDVQYDTDVLAVEGFPLTIPTPNGFTIHVHQDEAPVRRQGSSNSPVVGKVCIGDVTYTPQ